MLQDPKRDKEVWTDYVWADTEAQAIKLCEIKAEEATSEGRTVVRLIGQPKRVGKGKRYECTFKGEVYNTRSSNILCRDAMFLASLLCVCGKYL